MKAVGLYKYLPIDHPESLVDVDVPMPEPGPRDLLVKVHAVSVNPVQISIGGTNVAPLFSGVSGAPGLFQFNLTIPAGLGPGDVALVATVSGATTQTGVVIPLQ